MLRKMARSVAPQGFRRPAPNPAQPPCPLPRHTANMMTRNWFIAEAPLALWHAARSPAEIHCAASSARGVL